MNLRRSIGVGAAAALLVGGCGSHPGPTQALPQTPDKSTANPSSAEQAKWEARSGGQPGDDRPTPQQLAERTSSYARTMESPGGSAGTAAVDGSPGQSTASKGATPSSVQFDTPAARPQQQVLPPPLDVSVSSLPRTATAPSAALPPDFRPAVLASAAKSSVLSDMPQSVADSAEFAPPPSASQVVDPLGVRLAKRSRGNPRDAVAQLDYQLYTMLNGGADAPEATLASSAGLPSDERDVISTLVDGVSNFRSGLAGDPNLTPTHQVRPLEDMVDHLRSGTDLVLGTVALCRSVTAYGLYDPFTPARFPAGRSSVLYVYCEVDNFLPRKTADGRWETRLAQQLSLYTADGTLVWPDKVHNLSDVCRDRRRDFYTKEPIVLPPSLEPGEYKLNVSVTDRNAGKYNESKVTLWIGGAEATAER